VARYTRHLESMSASVVCMLYIYIYIYIYIYMYLYKYIYIYIYLLMYSTHMYLYLCTGVTWALPGWVVPPSPRRPSARTPGPWRTVTDRDAKAPSGVHNDCHGKSAIFVEVPWAPGPSGDLTELWHRWPIYSWFMLIYLWTMVIFHSYVKLPEGKSPKMTCKIGQCP